MKKYNDGQNDQKRGHMKVKIDGETTGEFLGLMTDDDGYNSVVVRLENHGMCLRRFHPSHVSAVVDVEPTPAESIPSAVTVTDQMQTNLPGLREVIKLVLLGQKINAIKTVRMITNCGLREGKEYVESWEWLLPYVNPASR